MQKGQLWFKEYGLIALGQNRDGEIWFGGAKGVNSFYPDRLTNNLNPPPIVLTALTQGGELFNRETYRTPSRIKSLTFDWQHNFFEFEFTALNYTNAAKNKYAYKLEGIDQKWYQADTKRFGRYTGLPSGEYILRLKASNNDDITLVVVQV